MAVFILTVLNLDERSSRFDRRPDANEVQCPAAAGTASPGTHRPRQQKVRSTWNSPQGHGLGRTEVVSAISGIESTREHNLLFRIDVATDAETIVGDVGREFQPASDASPTIRFSLAPDGKTFAYSVARYRICGCCAGLLDGLASSLVWVFKDPLGRRRALASGQPPCADPLTTALKPILERQL